MTEVHSITIQIARPSGPNDPGAVEIGHYTVTDDLVRLTDATGEPLTRAGSTPTARGTKAVSVRWERKMRPDETALRVAGQLLWARYRASKKGNDFNRPLNWPRMSIV